MGISFRKSIQIMPGVKLNISKSGLSVSAGVNGLHASINTKGQVRGTASIPGTGLRYSKSTKISNLIPGAKDEKSEKSSEKSKASSKTKTSADTSKKGAKAETSADTSKKVTKAETPAVTELDAANTAKSKQDQAESSFQDIQVDAGRGSGTKTTGAKKQQAQTIIDLYAIADKNLDWVSIKNSPKNLGYENWDYLKARASKVLDGDFDTYLELINDINPFAELIELGSSFECGTDNPMKIEVLCDVNAEAVLGEYKDDKDLLEDYIAGTAIKGARDIFAILPVWQVEFTCTQGDATVLHVNFSRDSFETLNFAKIDASDTIRKLGGILSV